MKAAGTTRVAIACGGTGGHLFPGLAVGTQLAERGCDVTLLVSPKEVDQQGVKSAGDFKVVTLPAVGLGTKGTLAFLRGFHRSYRLAQQVFAESTPDAVLAMGGFTSAPPILAGRRRGAMTFLHESNTIPGRANRWLSWIVDQAFVGFPAAGVRLHTQKVKVTGTPVRPEFRPQAAGECRIALGLEAERPVVLVMGGSQGASGVNELIIQALPTFAKIAPAWQWFHLAGPTDVEKVKSAYESARLKAVVHAFFGPMEIALSAATAAVSRSGASSLAELAAMRLPAVLVPYPSATDNHQYHNAHAFERTGAARLLEQKGTTTESLVRLLTDLVQNGAARQWVQSSLAQWHAPCAAAQIAEAIISELARAKKMKSSRGGKSSAQQSSSSADHSELAHAPLAANRSYRSGGAL